MSVVHCKKEHYDVYIGRPSKWGNPFIIGKDGTREEVIKKYLDWIKGSKIFCDKMPPKISEIENELRGKVLGCWCSPNPCHGDILYSIANLYK